MPLYLTEAEVAELLTPADAVEAVEACFRRLAAGEIEIKNRKTGERETLPMADAKKRFGAAA